MTTAAELLSVEDGKPVHEDPLGKWRFRFYPEHGYWRRTRSHRDVVPRERVAREVGVSEEVVEAWEKAAVAASFA